MEVDRTLAQDSKKLAEVAWGTQRRIGFIAATHQPGEPMHL